MGAVVLGRIEQAGSYPARLVETDAQITRVSATSPIALHAIFNGAALIAAVSV